MPGKGQLTAFGVAQGGHHVQREVGEEGEGMGGTDRLRGQERVDVGVVQLAQPLLELEQWQAVLDVGSGYSWTTEWLLRSGHEAIGIDLCRAYLEIGLARVGPNRPHLLIADAEHLPRVFALVTKYADQPMDLADACVVRMTELNAQCKV